MLTAVPDDWIWLPQYHSMMIVMHASGAAEIGRPSYSPTKNCCNVGIEQQPSYAWDDC